jgi:hypothetical protein
MLREFMLSFNARAGLHGLNDIEALFLKAFYNLDCGDKGIFLAHRMPGCFREDAWSAFADLLVAEWLTFCG